MSYVLSAWKALRSVATVTGYEVPGKAWKGWCAWKALRHRTWSLNISKGVLPSRQNHCNRLLRGLRPRLLSLRSVLPSRQIVLNEIFCPRIARIGTNAMRGCFMTTTGTTWNCLLRAQRKCLELFFLPTNFTNLHESFSMNKMATSTVARIFTNSSGLPFWGDVLE